MARTGEGRGLGTWLHLLPQAGDLARTGEGGASGEGPRDLAPPPSAGWRRILVWQERAGLTGHSEILPGGEGYLFPPGVPTWCSHLVFPPGVGPLKALCGSPNPLIPGAGRGQRCSQPGGSPPKHLLSKVAI